MQSVTQCTFHHSIISYAFLYEGQAVTTDCLLDMYKDSLPLQTKKGTKAEFTGYRPDRRPGFIWEEVVQEDAVRLLLCRSCKLIAQNGAVLRQNVWEAKGRLQALMS